MVTMSSKVSEIIKKRREELGYDLNICSSQLKIQKKFLEGIENNDYTMFDNSFQAQGFVQNYCELLGISPLTLVPRWRKETLDFFKNEEREKDLYFKPSKKRKVNIVLTTDKLINFSLLTFFLGFLIYIFYNYSQAVRAPLLEISSPENNTISETDIIDVFGKTDRDAELKLNNDKITIHTDGNFSTSIKLSEGINTFRFTSVNPYQQETVKVLTVIYRPKKIEIYNPPVEITQTVPAISLPASSLPSSLTNPKN